MKSILLIDFISICSTFFKGNYQLVLLLQLNLQLQLLPNLLVELCAKGDLMELSLLSFRLFNKCDDSENLQNNNNIVIDYK